MNNIFILGLFVVLVWGSLIYMGYQHWLRTSLWEYEDHIVDELNEIEGGDWMYSEEKCIYYDLLSDRQYSTSEAENVVYGFLDKVE